MSFDLIIFDCDGVLIDSEPISCSVIITVLAELGLHMTHEEAISAFVGKAISTNLSYVEERLGRSLPDSFLINLQARTIEKFKTDLLPIEGIHEALSGINKPVCVASSSNLEWIDLALKTVGLSKYFQSNIFSASQVKRGKPAPDVYLHAAQTMGVVPSKCAVIEDTPTGVLAGTSAGMTVFGYTGSFTGDKLIEAGAHHTFDNMKELPNILNSVLAPS